MGKAAIAVVGNQLSLFDRAKRIRELVGAVRVNIILIGEELIAAKQQCNHGEWLSWLQNNFGWKKRTAENFMRVAEAFGKFATVANLNGGDFAIEARALYFLSAPTIPESLRKKAARKSKNGKAVTLEHAEKMVADAVAAAVTKAEKRIEAAKEQNAELAGELSQLKQSAKEPTEQDAIAMFCKLTGKRKLTARQHAALMIALEHQAIPEKFARELSTNPAIGNVADTNGKLQTGRTKEEDREQMQRLRPLTILTSSFDAIANIKVAPEELVVSIPDWYRKEVRRSFTAAWAWIEQFSSDWAIDEKRRTSHE
jgi:hypothetical protein